MRIPSGLNVVPKMLHCVCDELLEKGPACSGLRQEVTGMASLSHPPQLQYGLSHQTHPGKIEQSRFRNGGRHCSTCEDVSTMQCQSLRNEQRRHRVCGREKLPIRVDSPRLARESCHSLSTPLANILNLMMLHYYHAHNCCMFHLFLHILDHRFSCHRGSG